MHQDRKTGINNNRRNVYKAALGFYCLLHTEFRSEIFKTASWLLSWCCYHGNIIYFSFDSTISVIRCVLGNCRYTVTHYPFWENIFLEVISAFNFRNKICLDLLIARWKREVGLKDGFLDIAGESAEDRMLRTSQMISLNCIYLQK